MWFRMFGKRWSIWVLVAAGIVVLGLILLVVMLAWLLQPSHTRPNGPAAVFTMIPAPTGTPAPLPQAEGTLTPTPSTLIINGIGVGMYVQISGTEGDGLRLRSAPGTNNPPRFLGHESEVFQVKDGPRDADGYTWWYLVTPMDESRSGWAAANFLSVVSQPSPTP